MRNRLERKTRTQLYRLYLMSKIRRNNS